MNAPYPTINFGLGEEIDMLRDHVYAFAQGEIAPLAEKADEENAFPNQLWPQLGEMGLLGVTVSEQLRRCRYGLPGPRSGYGRDQPRICRYWFELRCPL